MVDRRSLLAAGAALVAGCSGVSSPGSETSPDGPDEGSATPPDDGGSATPTTVPDDPADSTPRSSPSGQPVDFAEGPKERPDRPANLTETSVREFVRTHEYRHAYNTLHYGETTNVSLSCSVLSVESAQSGYRAVVRCSGYSETRGTPTNGETATPLHADWGSRRYEYHVTENGTTRRPYTDD